MTQAVTAASASPRLAVAAALLVAAGVGWSGRPTRPPLINPVAPAGGAADAKAARRPADQTDFAKKAATPASGDLPMWGGTPHRNMVSAEKNPPTDGTSRPKQEHQVGAKLGSKAYGNPIVANGMVFVGTNNEATYDPKYTNPDGTAIDGGVLMASTRRPANSSGRSTSPSSPAGRVNDWPGEGLCSTVYAEKNRIWYCTNRCEVVCLDISRPREPQARSGSST